MHNFFFFAIYIHSNEIERDIRIENKRENVHPESLHGRISHDKGILLGGEKHENPYRYCDKRTIGQTQKKNERQIEREE